LIAAGNLRADIEIDNWNASVLTGTGAVASVSVPAEGDNSLTPTLTNTTTGETAIVQIVANNTLGSFDSGGDAVGIDSITDSVNGFDYTILGGEYITFTFNVPVIVTRVSFDGLDFANTGQYEFVDVRLNDVSTYTLFDSAAAGSLGSITHPGETLTSGDALTPNWYIPTSTELQFRYGDVGSPVSLGWLLNDFRFTTAIPEPTAYLFGGLICCVVGLAAASRRWLGKARSENAAA
jgi:hypothetical protein